ncbi:hypothetical protein [Prescottella equi]|uniref:hypothetical protein n=1 Tax=Rhodococcus hoagii TaxID=43767 RepID=UPI0007CD7FD0|nr:hypothetical protein [Prescottella equi]
MFEDSLSREALEFAAEIRNHDWSDAPYRIDRAGHRRENDTQPRLTETVLSAEETERVRLNVVWVVAQVLMHQDPNLDVEKFAEASGVSGRLLRNHNGQYSGTLREGIRREADGSISEPGGKKQP